MFALGLVVFSVQAAPTIYLADSPAAQELVDEALALKEQGRLNDAAARLQQVITEYPHRLMEVEPGRHEDALRWVRRRLHEDQVLFEAYQSTYNARAERERQAAMSAPLDPADLERVVAQYATTEPGLEAGLALAAVYLERARAHSAASLLDELEDHPQLDQHFERYHYLQAAAGVLTADPRRHDTHVQRLTEAGHATQADAVASLAEQLSGPVRPALEPLRVVDESLPTDAMEGPLWEGATDWTPMGPANAELPLRRFGRNDEDEQPVPMLPRADERRIYLNEGDRIRALDRDSGWELWTYEWRGVEELGELPAMMRMRGQSMLHERAVLPQDDRLYAVLGAATPWPSQWNQGGTATALVSLDLATGRQAWARQPGELEGSLDDAYFVGTPHGGDDRVFVLLRRSQASGFKDTYLAAISSDNGKLLWHRHIAATAMTSRFSAGPRPRMVLGDGLVYVADNLGAVAALDQRTGTVKWLRLLGDAVQGDEDDPRAAGPQRSTDISVKPLRCDAGLIVRDPIESTMLLLDPRTGRVLRTLAGQPWRDARALLPMGEHVLVIGSTLTLVDGETLESQWRHSFEGDDPPASPLGQIAATRDHLFYALHDRLVVLRRDDGRILQQRNVQTPANVLPLETQVVLVGPESIRSYTSWSRAVARLRQRMEQSPAEPAPALALAQLAARRGDSEMLLTSVEHALTALRQALHEAAENDLTHDDTMRETFKDVAQRVQQRTFAQVLNLARHEAITDAEDGMELREALFDRVAMITDGPEQEVAYHLAVAEFLAEAREPREAVEHLQVVLTDDVLSAQLYESVPVSRQAGLEANQRLHALIEEHGRAVYDIYEQRASQQLEQLVAGRAEADELVALAERYPLATAASQALVHAAQRFVEQDRFSAAAEQLRRARDRARTPELMAQVVGQAAALYEAHGEPGRAIAWLRRLQREHPGVTPKRDGESLPINRWIARLEEMEPGTGSLPTLSLPLGEPRLVEGRLLPVPREYWAITQRDVLLTETKEMLQRYDADTLELRWQTALPFEAPRLVGADEQRLLFWSPRSHELMALDEATGEPVWAEHDVATLLAETGDAGDRAEAQAVDRRRFEPLLQQQLHVARAQGNAAVREAEPQRFAAVGASSIALADHMGRVVGLDRRSGQVRWQLMSPIERVTHARVRHDMLVLGGVLGPGTDTATGAIVVLDLRTGERIMPIIEDRQLPQWIGFAGDRLLVVASEDQLTAYHLGSGAVAWRAQVSATPLGETGWASERLVMMLDEMGVGLLFDAETGQRLRRVHLSDELGRRAVHIDPIEQRWYIHTTEGLTCLDGAGEVQWRDAIAERAHTPLAHFVTREHVVLLTQRRAVARDGEQAPAWVVQPGGDGPVRVRVEPLEPDRPDNDERDERDANGPNAEEGGFDYHLYLIDRRSGSLIAEHPLGPLPERLTVDPALAQQHRLVIPAGDRTLVIPDHRVDTGKGGDPE